MGSADRYINDQTRMEAERSSFTNVIEDVARYVLPSFACFRTSQSGFEHVTETQHVWDTHAMDALDKGVSIAKYFTMPRERIWHMIAPADDELLKLPHVKLWYERKSKLYFQRLYDALSGFAAESTVQWAQLLGFGNGALSVDLRRDHVTKLPMGFGFRSEHVGQVFIDENFQRQVTRSHRKFELSAEAAWGQWGDKLIRADRVMTAARDENKRHEKFEFIKVIEPNPNFQAGRADKWGKAWHECYVSVTDKEVIADGGTNARSMVYSRLKRKPNSKYGDGPGVEKLPDIKECQQIHLDIAVSNEMALLPGYGLHDDMQDNMVRVGPNEFSYGAINARGERMVVPIFEGGDATGAEGQLERLHQGIDRRFYGDLLQLYQELKTHITATERLQRREELGVVLDPLMSQEEEWFAPMLDRCIELGAQLGDYDDMPGEVREAGGLYSSKFDNPLTRAQIASRAMGYFKMKEEVISLAAVYPEAPVELERLYPLRKVLPGIADSLDVSMEWAATPDEIARFDADRAQDKAMKDALATLPDVAGAAKDFAQAEKFANAA